MTLYQLQPLLIVECYERMIAYDLIQRTVEKEIVVYFKKLHRIHIKRQYDEKY
jgi:hypothetical protein